MSTRCNIIIRNSLTGETTQVYRHQDGYPSDTGEDLKEICEKAAFDRAGILAGMEASKSKYTKRSHYEVEIEDGEPDLHCDLDWVYVIDTRNRRLTAYKVCPFQYTPELAWVMENYITRVEIIK